MYHLLTILAGGDATAREVVGPRLPLPLSKLAFLMLRKFKWGNTYDFKVVKSFSRPSSPRRMEKPHVN
jgi:hypothetical protein